MNRPTKIMVEHLNLKLKEEGTCLRYVEKYEDSGITSYGLKVNDKYVDKKFDTNLIVTEEFEKYVRDFFKKYNVENIGFSNTVCTIFATEK